MTTIPIVVELPAGAVRTGQNEWTVWRAPLDRDVYEQLPDGRYRRTVTVRPSGDGFAMGVDFSEAP